MSEVFLLPGCSIWSDVEILGMPAAAQPYAALSGIAEGQKWICLLMCGGFSMKLL
jgi:hypothetical protein